ncbi:membrane protein [Secundilactobacillus pentosiphilus]|uniref:Membrane protein n=1 Tax=Secundilactobacillus pentosiphilus TaxID=1714682 RepID=A0A1Z5ISS1_9LACO|nr:membrane protein [Secundilactobacillus pentosiphilus]
MRKIYEKLPVWLIYTIIFTLITLCTFGSLRFMGLTNIWRMDGIAQHYPILAQFYRILHGTAHQSLFSWSWNLGLGADQMTTFAYYVVGDPFSYLIALFPASQLQLGYLLLTILRLYAVGLAFLVFAKQLQLKRGGRLIGTLVYTFTSLSFYVSFHHPFFLLPLIFFPLLCAAVDKIYHGQSFLWLVAITAVVLISNVYFAYLLGIGSLFFAVIRYFDLKRKGELVRSFPKSCGYFGLTVVMALLIAAMVLLPNIDATLNSSRSSGASIFANGLKLYPGIYYLKLPNALLDSTAGRLYWAVMGTSGLSLLAMMWTLRHFKKYFMLNVTLILILVGMLLPQFAAVMNVMSTPSNRWLLLAQLVFALTAGIFVDHLNELVPADFKWLLSGTVIFLALCWAGNGFRFKLSAHRLIIYGIYLLFLLVIAAGLIFGFKGVRFRLTLLSLMIVNLISLGLGLYSSNYNLTLRRDELSRGTGDHWMKAYYDYADRYLKQHDQSFYRTATTSNYYHPHNIPQTMQTVGNNIPMLLDTHTIGSYFSVQNKAVNDFNKTLRNSENTMNNPTSNVDNRTTMSSLLNVKYLFVRANQVGKAKVPYGFKIVRNEQGKPKLFSNRSVYMLDNQSGTALYRNQYALPLAYTQTQQLDRNAFLKLSANDREQALLDGTLTAHRLPGVRTVKAGTVTKPVAYSVKMHYQPFTTVAQAMAYRLKHDTSESVTGKIKAKKLTPKQVKRNNNKAKISKPSQAVMKLLQQNRGIVEQNNQANHDGLKELTNDKLGQNADYTVTLKNPSAYKNCELYMEFDGIRAQFPSISDRLNNTANRSLMANVPFSPGIKLNDWRDFTKKPSFDAFNLVVKSPNRKEIVQQLPIDNMSDYEKKNQTLVNLGYSEQARKTIKVSFTKAKRLSFKRVRIIAVPFDQNYRQRTTQLQNQTLKQLRVTNNRVSGATDEPQASVLTTSIPYTTGWQLTVDGRHTPIQQVNNGFVGAKLPAGRHQIRLIYQTPGLLAGRWLSAVGLILFVFGTAVEVWRWLGRKQVTKH